MAALCHLENTVTCNTNTSAHPLEDDDSERAYFEGTTDTHARATYRRAVLRLTGHLPSWAARKKPGRKSNAERSALGEIMGGAAE